MENAFKDNECGLIQLGWGFFWGGGCYVFVVVWFFFSMFCSNHIKMLLKSCKLHVYLFSLTYRSVCFRLKRETIMFMHQDLTHHYLYHSELAQTQVIKSDHLCSNLHNTKY